MRAAKMGALRRWCLGLAVDAYAKAILHSLIQYVDENGECWPSVERIARESGMSPRKARATIRRLEDHGLLSVVRSQGRCTNRYRLSANPAQRAGLAHVQPGTQGRVNPAQHAGLENANPASQVPQPGTVCRLLVRTGIKGAGQGENSPEQNSGDDLREVAP